ncbi:MAG TPA: hypothetical protein VFZ34_18305 [Blastocatellia bacterium]|nr:hypothetical protein [Blastocatellia bacterium]
MANQGATKQSKQTSQNKSQSGQHPLDNLSYDMVTVLYEKSKALEAFDKYLQDAQSDKQARELFEQMRQADEDFVQQLRDQLGQRLGATGQTTGRTSSRTM